MALVAAAVRHCVSLAEVQEIPSTQRGAHKHSWRVSCAHGNRHGMKFNRECANSYAPSASSAAPDQTSKIAFQRVPKVKEF